MVVIYQSILTMIPIDRVAYYYSAPFLSSLSTASFQWCPRRNRETFCGGVCVCPVYQCSGFLMVKEFSLLFWMLRVLLHADSVCIRKIMSYD
jgi:hypothetical protein